MTEQQQMLTSAIKTADTEFEWWKVGVVVMAMVLLALVAIY